ncbi:unnamed protein product [Durusdinium trenchii]
MQTAAQERRGSTRERSDVADLEKQLVQNQLSPLPRNNSWSGPAIENSDMSARLREPGGFRRNFLHQQALQEGREVDGRWSERLIDTLAVHSFQVESHFYGLDLDEEPSAVRPVTGTAGDLNIAFLIFKGNCGCAILYMPRGWMHGGLVLASITVPMIGLISIWCSLLLLKVRMQDSGHQGYGDLIGAAFGLYGRKCANLFIMLLQSGICCTYFIVACKLLQSTICPGLGFNILIPCMVLVVLPVVAIRKISSLWPLSLLGTALVIFGILVVFGLELGALAHEQPDDLILSNWSGVLVCLGQACFMFEGIGLILPTFDASKNPQHFPWIYIVTQTGTLCLVCCIGLFGYLAFGQGVHNLILLDFQPNVLVFLVRMAFMIQVLCSFPLQMLPATRLIELSFFGPPVSDPPSARKLAKSGFRAVLVAVFALIAYAGASHLDNFVSLIGALCGVPLAFIFPAAAHYFLIERCCSDLLLMAFGVILTVLVTAVNLAAFL